MLHFISWCWGMWMSRWGHILYGEPKCSFLRKGFPYNSSCRKFPHIPQTLHDHDDVVVVVRWCCMGFRMHPMYLLYIILLFSSYKLWNFKIWTRHSCVFVKIATTTQEKQQKKNKSATLTTLPYNNIGVLGKHLRLGEKTIPPLGLNGLFPSRNNGKTRSAMAHPQIPRYTAFGGNGCWIPQKIESQEITEKIERWCLKAWNKVVS